MYPFKMYIEFVLNSHKLISMYSSYQFARILSEFKQLAVNPRFLDSLEMKLFRGWKVTTFQKQ